MLDPPGSILDDAIPAASILIAADQVVEDVGGSWAPPGLASGLHVATVIRSPISLVGVPLLIAMVAIPVSLSLLLPHLIHAATLVGVTIVAPMVEEPLSLPEDIVIGSRFAVGNRVTPVPPGRRGWSPTPDSHRT